MDMDTIFPAIPRRSQPSSSKQRRKKTVAPDGPQILEARVYFPRQFSSTPTANTYQKHLIKALDELKSSGGTFASTSSHIDAPNPGVSIDGLSPIGLPLSPTDAQRLIEFGRESHFGHGEKTLVDPAVSKTHEIDAEKKYYGHCWCMRQEVTLRSIASRLLRVGGSVLEADRRGRSQKEDGMFATLAVVLPSTFEGGELVFKHGEETMCFDPQLTGEFSTSVAAWYADVLHCVKPVTSGYRFVLTYNLTYNLMISKYRHPAPSIPSSEPGNQVQAALAVLHRYNKQAGYVLSHLYSGMNYATLKEPDKVAVDYLTQIANEVGFEVWLATFKIHWKGPEEDRDKKIIPVNIQWYVDITERVAGNGQSDPVQLDWNEQHFGDDQDEFYRGRKSYDYKSHYTGNEGYEVDCWYREACVLLCPVEQKRSRAEWEGVDVGEPQAKKQEIGE
ncbi:hypothetical protein K440DRAFT_636307 [Wilcoxina mikolae CBS 423.85]|nr:hypothetical protein K440DRAFT_636307 [Wilcoxina mikolae CBS 423.85]